MSYFELILAKDVIFFYFVYSFIWMWWVFVTAHRLSVSSATCGLLIVVPSLVADHWF